MVPFNRPIPDSKPPNKLSGGLGGIIQAEKAMQMALTLPSAVAVGWLLGAWADHAFLQEWIGIAGIVLGSVAGLTYIVRMAIAGEQASRPGNGAGDGAEKGSADRKP
jgi:F0F1-type ATP synthase assembly protein I